jgi:hypothetical protein
MREVEVELAAFHQGYATPMPVEGSRKVRRLRGTPCPLWVVSDRRLSAMTGHAELAPDFRKSGRQYDRS